MLRKLIIKLGDDNGTSTPLLIPEVGAFLHVVLSQNSSNDIVVIFSNYLFIDLETVTFNLSPYLLRDEILALAHNHTFVNMVNKLVDTTDKLLDHRQAWEDLYTFLECLETK